MEASPPPPLPSHLTAGRQREPVQHAALFPGEEPSQQQEMEVLQSKAKKPR